MGGREGHQEVKGEGSGIFRLCADGRWRCGIISSHTVGARGGRGGVGGRGLDCFAL